MHPRLTLAALAALFAPAALAQSPVDFLPREPGLAPPLERMVTAPDPQEETGPITSVAADGGPGIVLGGITLEGATVIDQAELEPIWAELIGQPVTLTALEDIATRIGAAYRARGFVLSQAILPAQSVENGQVTILVVEGFVNRVEITGGADNQNAYAATRFAPVTAERPLSLSTLERGILLSRDTFGGTVETVLEPSADTFGAADLGVLIEPDPITYFAAIDNRGSRLYGEWTLGAGARAYNLLGQNERLDALVAGAPKDGSLAFGALSYDAPIPRLNGTRFDGTRWVVEADISRADPDLAQSGSPETLEIIQNETNLRAGVITPFIRTRSQNLFAFLGLGFRESESETAFTGPDMTETDRLAVLDAGLTWDVADRFGGVSLVDAAIRQGLDIGGVEVGATGPAAGNPDFTLATLRLSRLQRLGDTDWSLFGEAIGQYASTVLPTSERFSLGDGSIGRGFAPGNTSGDSGYGLRGEVRYTVFSENPDGPVDAIEIYGYGDFGQAYDRTAERDLDQWETLGSVGIGALIDVRDWLTITPEIARQLEGVPTDTTNPDLETRFYIGAVARF